MACIIKNLKERLDKVSRRDMTVAAGVVVTGASLYCLYNTFLSSHLGSDSKEATEHQKALKDSGKAATQADIANCAGLLKDANKTAPVYTAIASDKSAVGSGLTKLYTAILRSTVPTSFGCVVLKTSQAVAVWVPPGAAVSPDTLAFHGFGCAAKALCGSSAARRVTGLQSSLASRAARINGDKPTFVLEAAGSVSVSGLAEVVAPVIARADAVKAACFHAAFNPAVSSVLTSDFGFKVVETMSYFNSTIELLHRPASSS